MMIITVITICKARMPKNKKDDAAPFARAQPYYCLKQSHRSHVLFMNDHIDTNKMFFWIGHHFLCSELNTVVTLSSSQ